jgi:hypothetical protein
MGAHKPQRRGLDASADALISYYQPGTQPPRTWPPARLDEPTEADYRRHVTERAAFIGIPERDLLDHIARVIERAQHQST